MGADKAPHPEDGEGPARDAWVDSFAISPTAASNSEFADFVAATGFQTLAQKVGTSFVFHAFLREPNTFSAPRHAPWWRQVPGACWSSPEGGESTIRGREDHPVVHIGQADALAFCRWSGTRLPSEAEWEYAARGGLTEQPFPWGGELEAGRTHHCNVWQGDFPNGNTGADGYFGTAPVRAFAPNGHGLFNMIGNVWERVADRFTRLHSPRPARNFKGPLNGVDHVAKGGSYLCHISYCARFRTSSRQALGPDTLAGNVGFRVARAASG